MAANGDMEMQDRNRPPKPDRVEVLIAPENPLAVFFSSLPGFHKEIAVVETQKEAKFLDLQKLIATTELLKTKWPQYDYSIEVVKDRRNQRKTIDAKISAEKLTHKKKMADAEKAYQKKMYDLKREQQFLKQLEQIDDNIFIINSEIEETNKHLNPKAYKEAKKQRLEQARQERDDAFIETQRAQDARRYLEAQRRDAKRARHSTPLPELQEEEEEPAANPFGSTAASG